MIKRNLFLVVCVLGFLTAGAKDKDTTFIKRPYFLGLSLGYTHFTHQLGNNQYTPPVHLSDLYSANQLDYGVTPAIQLSFPFLRKMECEVGIQRTTWYGTRAEVSEYHYAGPFGSDIVGFRTTRKLYDYSVWQSRVVFSRVLSQKENFMLLLGAGGWLDLQNKEDRNNYGCDLQLKCYFMNDHFGNFQLTAFGGGNGLDLYAGVRIGYMMKGTRTYRVKPDKYYVRTYEE